MDGNKMNDYKEYTRPNKYVPEICEYLNINPNDKYYKSYILKCILNKLNTNIWNQYILDDNLVKIFRANNANFYWNNVSKSRIYSYIEKLKFETSVPSYVHLIKINEQALETPSTIII